MGIYSSRFEGPRYVAFDFPTDLPGKCVFRVRSKGQSYMIPYEQKAMQTSSQQDVPSVKSSEISAKVKNEQQEETSAAQEKSNENKTQ